MADALTPEGIASALSRSVFRFSNEKDLQDGIERVLRKKGVDFEREVALSPHDRIDFLAGNVGIEVKVDSAPNSVQRQLWRYAEHERIAVLILVTTRSSHKTIAREILEKPVLIVHLLNSIF